MYKVRAWLKFLNKHITVSISKRSERAAVKVYLGAYFAKKRKFELEWILIKSKFKVNLWKSDVKY